MNDSTIIGITEISDYIFNIKNNLKDQEFIDIMNLLGKIYKTNNKIPHMLSLSINTQWKVQCELEDDETGIHFNIVRLPIYLTKKHSIEFSDDSEDSIILKHLVDKEGTFPIESVNKLNNAYNNHNKRLISDIFNQDPDTDSIKITKTYLQYLSCDIIET